MIDAVVYEVLREETQRPPAAEVDTLAKAVRARFGGAVRCILFYGSCRRGVGLRDGIVDFWVVVDARRAAERPWAARLGSWLPPNVYFLAVDDGVSVLRAKVALFTLEELARGATAFETYVWGRLAQPISLVFAATPADERAVLEVLAHSADTFLSDALPQAAGMSVLDAWRTGLARSYAAELRAEGHGRAADVVGADADYYIALTASLRPAWVVGDGAATRVRGASGDARFAGIDVRGLARRWPWRRRLGKLRSLARLLKGLYTFDGGFDYIAWKLSRHAGREIVIPARVRRWPWLFLWPLMWRLYREGVFR